MDLASVATLLLLGLLLAAQPWSVLGSILLVTSVGGAGKDVAYVAGWVTALAAVAGLTVAAYPAAPSAVTSGSGPAVAEIVLGVVLGAWLLHRWRAVSGSSAEPGWLKRLDTIGPLAAFALGAFLPTYAAVVAAVTEMLSSGLSQASLAFVALLWVLLASAGVAAPLAVRVRSRERAPAVYARWRAWIVGHNRAVAYGAGAVVAVVLVLKGVVGLAA